MPLMKGTNSYVSLAEADAYLIDRSDEDGWQAASVEVQDKALVTAWRLLENLPWKGYVASESQAMAWPRVAQVFRPSRGRTASYLGTETESPDPVKQAQIELAVHLVANPGITLDSSKPASINLGSIAVEGVRSPRVVPKAVRQIVEDFIAPSDLRRVW